MLCRREASDTMTNIEVRSNAMNDLIYGSATKIASEIRQKNVSCLEVIEMHLKRIEVVNPALNAVVQLCSERALAEAKAADVKISKKENTCI